MPDMATLEALRDIFWPVWLATMLVATGAAVAMRRWCLARAVAALAFGSIAQWAWESTLPPSEYLLWWQHLVIDLPIFVIVTMPPRHYWQSALGALVFAQLVLHATWGMAPQLGQEHWFGGVLIGFAKCALLLLWSGGSRVERVLGRIARGADRMVLAAPRRKLA